MWYIRYPSYLILLYFFTVNRLSTYCTLSYLPFDIWMVDIWYLIVDATLSSSLNRQHSRRSAPPTHPCTSPVSLRGIRSLLSLLDSLTLSHTVIAHNRNIWLVMMSLGENCRTVPINQQRNPILNIYPIQNTQQLWFLGRV